MKKGMIKAMGILVVAALLLGVSSKVRNGGASFAETAATPMFLAAVR